MKTISLLLALATALLGGAASAQSGEELLASKGCLGCHGIDEKGMGPALKLAVAKYKGAETKLIAVLKEGKGHPIKVDATGAELKTIIGYLAGQKTGPAKPAAPRTKAGAAPEKPAAAPAQAAAVLDKAICLGCHGNEGFAMPGPGGKPRPLYVVPDRFEHSVHGKWRWCATGPRGSAAREPISCSGRSGPRPRRAARFPASCPLSAPLSTSRRGR
jgi:cytochrome c